MSIITSLAHSNVHPALYVGLASLPIIHGVRALRSRLYGDACAEMAVCVLHLLLAPLYIQ